MQELDLAGRTALVTGAAGGLGAAIAKALADAGAEVVAADALRPAEDAGDVVHLDVTDDASWERSIAEAVARLGGLDIVVNSAEVEFAGPIVDLDPERVRAQLDVNVLGTALGLKHAFRAMRPGGAAGRGGSVINVASVAAAVAFVDSSVYSATKSAVDRLTRVASLESRSLGYGVRVNCVCRGLVPGEVRPATGRLEMPPEMTEEMGDAVVFLASDAARSITGVGLPVGGEGDDSVLRHLPPLRGPHPRTAVVSGESLSADDGLHPREGRARATRRWASG